LINFIVNNKLGLKNQKTLGKFFVKVVFMDLLVFGDPEGKLQRRKKEVIKIIREYEPDYVIFLGDYFSWAGEYYNQLKKYLKNREFFNLYPEAKIIDEIFDKYNFVFVYGNKDLKPEVLRVRKIKEKQKPKTFLLTFDKWDEVEEFLIINGSNVFGVPEKFKNSIEKEIIEFFNERDEILLKKFKARIIAGNIKFLNKKREFDVRRVKKELKIVYKKLWEKYPYAKMLMKNAYWYDMSFVSRIKSNKEIILTHTPPNLHNEEVIFGEYPDMAIYKIVKGFNVQPAKPNEPEAIKKNVGLESIKKFILKNQPKIVFCGHIHEGSGIAKIKETGTIVINPGSFVAFQNYKKIVPYTFIRLKETGIRIEARSFYGMYRGFVRR